jgi:hypothetical protein
MFSGTFMYPNSDYRTSHVHSGRQSELRFQAAFLIHLPYQFSDALFSFRSDKSFPNVSRRIDFLPKRRLIAEVVMINAEAAYSLIDAALLCKSAVDYWANFQVHYNMLDMAPITAGIEATFAHFVYEPGVWIVILGKYFKTFRLLNVGITLSCH